MASELKEAIKTAADQIAKYVEDAATMTVDTKYVEMGAAGFDEAKLAARTIVKLDGDSETVLPMRKTDSGALEVDTAVFELHQQNVQTAIDYRAKMLNSLIQLLRGAQSPQVPPTVG
ncbi:MAG: hypothetical protein C0393_00960 [Anaerolinea sp.]|nr:hypothetical protein [Anaerolinea sp.]